MAAGGGHWLKSPFYSQGSVFMPAMKEDGDTVTIGDIMVKPINEGKSYGIFQGGELTDSYGYKQNAVLHAAVLQASHIQSPNVPSAVKKKVYDDVGKSIDNLPGKIMEFTDWTPTKIYSGFLGMMVKMTGGTPPTTGGLFED